MKSLGDDMKCETGSVSQNSAENLWSNVQVCPHATRNSCLEAGRIQLRWGRVDWDQDSFHYSEFWSAFICVVHDFSSWYQYRIWRASSLENACGKPGGHDAPLHLEMHVSPHHSPKERFCTTKSQKVMGWTSWDAKKLRRLMEQSKSNDAGLTKSWTG